MNSGTQAAKEAANMIDLDSDPTKLIDVVQIGKQLLATRGALTTFSLANDIAKYFAIVPAMFTPIFPQLSPLNIMHLGTPETAIASSVIFNAIVIGLLLPIAMRGVTITAQSPVTILRRNLLIYGVGGIIVPFIGIKLIDMLIGMWI
jgi:K+-transporting ATPase ATPase B chain